MPGPAVVAEPRVGRERAAGQREYLRSIAEHDIVIGIGPAGTGKTYLAVAAAVDALARKRVRRIILARPAVEAGENLGFLPGDLLLFGLTYAFTLVVLPTFLMLLAVGAVELKDANPGKAKAVGTFSWAPKNTRAMSMPVNRRSIEARNCFT